jgi:hypothetical protein
MTRRRAGKLTKLIKGQRAAKAKRDLERGRDRAAIVWAKAHVVPDKTNPFKGLNLKSKKNRNAEAMADALSKVPAVEDAKARRR